jgi:hypothetical protein
MKKVHVASNDTAPLVFPFGADVQRRAGAEYYPVGGRGVTPSGRRGRECRDIPCIRIRSPPPFGGP